MFGKYSVQSLMVKASLMQKKPKSSATRKLFVPLQVPTSEILSLSWFPDNVLLPTEVDSEDTVEGYGEKRFCWD